MKGFHEYSSVRDSIYLVYIRSRVNPQHRTMVINSNSMFLRKEKHTTTLTEYQSSQVYNSWAQHVAARLAGRMLLDGYRGLHDKRTRNDGNEVLTCPYHRLKTGSNGRFFGYACFATAGLLWGFSLRGWGILLRSGPAAIHGAKCSAGIRTRVTATAIACKASGYLLHKTAPAKKKKKKRKKKKKTKKEREKKKTSPGKTTDLLI